MALLLFVFVLGRLWSVLRAAEGEGAWLSAAALGTGVIGFAVKLGSVPLAVAAYDRGRHGLDPEVARALVDANDFAFVLTWAIGAAFLVAVAIVVLRTRVLPRWSGWSASAFAAVLLVAVAFGPAAGPAFLVFPLWVAAASVVLLRRADDHLRLEAASGA